MLMTMIAIWAIVLPLTILAVSWQTARLLDERRLQTADRSVPRLASPVGSLPACAHRAARPRRTVTRRVCPEFPRSAGRRWPRPDPASAAQLLEKPRPRLASSRRSSTRSTRP